MIPFPLPGVTRWQDNTPYTIVASDHYTDETAVCLAIVPTSPHFVIINVTLEHTPNIPAGNIIEVSDRTHNIGTAVAYYADWGGTVCDIDPSPIEAALEPTGPQGHHRAAAMRALGTVCDNCGEADGTVKARPADPGETKLSIVDFGHGDLCDTCEATRSMMPS